jgi:hypothetical protein
MALPPSVVAWSLIVRALPLVTRSLPLKTGAWTLMPRGPPVILRAFAADNEGSGR